MRQYHAGTLVVHPGSSQDPDVIVEVTHELAGWDYISFQVRCLAAGRSWTFATNDVELAIVVLSGRISVASRRGKWEHIGRRESVFAGLPYALYLPRHTSFTVRAESDCEFAVASAPTDRDYEPRLVTPPNIEIEIRGGDNATRQINNIIPPGCPCQRHVLWNRYDGSSHQVFRGQIEEWFPCVHHRSPFASQFSNLLCSSIRAPGVGKDHAESSGSAWQASGAA